MFLVSFISQSFQAGRAFTVVGAAAAAFAQLRLLDLSVWPGIILFFAGLTLSLAAKITLSRHLRGSIDRFIAEEEEKLLIREPEERLEPEEWMLDHPIMQGELSDAERQRRIRYLRHEAEIM